MNQDIIFVDGKALLPKYLLELKNKKTLESLIDIIPVENRYDKGIKCYFESEKEGFEGILRSKNIPFTQTIFNNSKEIEKKIEKRKYKNKSEILNHLEKNIEPDDNHEVITIRNKVEELECKITQLEKQISLLLSTQK